MPEIHFEALGHDTVVLRTDIDDMRDRRDLFTLHEICVELRKRVCIQKTHRT